LTIEEHTPLGKWVQKGLIESPDVDVAADMYEWAMELLSDYGYRQYEISNWARLNSNAEMLMCRHNHHYWLNLPYIGLGAGAHGYINNVRLVNIYSPQDYIKRLNNVQRVDLIGVSGHDHILPRSPAIVECVTIDKATEMSETMIMGLRLVEEGIDKSRFLARFNIPLEEVYGAEIDKLIRLGLLNWTDDEERLRLTLKGRLLGNQVFMEFI
jgi:oxygen-independent coproporphyrinogen III oxidase